MPAQGRGAFLTPRAKPPPPPPHRAPIPVPHVSLAHVVGKAVAEATHAVAPATHAAQKVQAKQFTHAASQAASRARSGVVGKRAPAPLPPAVLQALIRQHPLLRYGDPGSLHEALIAQQQEHTGAAPGPTLALGRRLGERPRPARPPSPSLAAALLTLPQTIGAASAQGWHNILGTSGVGGGAADLLGNAAKDVGAIGSLPLLGGYQVAGAAFQAGQGNLKPTKELAEVIAKGFAQGVPGQLVQGNFSKAADQLYQHPILGPLELSGASSAAGRVAGALGRSGALEGTALARLSHAVRSPIALTDEAAQAADPLSAEIHQRTFSPSLDRALVQRLVDRHTREPVRDAQGKIVTRTERGATVPVLKARSEREAAALQRKRATYIARQEQDTENFNREMGAKAAHKASKDLPSKLDPRTRTRLIAEHLVQPAIEGVLRTPKTFRADLEKRIAVIKNSLEHGSYRHEDELTAARFNLKVLESARDSKAVARYVPGIFKAAERHAHNLNAADEQLAAADALPVADRAEHGRLSAAALAHMDATHAPDPQLAESLSKAHAVLRRAEAAGDEKAIARAEAVVAKVERRTKASERLRGPDGQPITHEQIEAHLHAAGRDPASVAYLPHRLDAELKSDFHRPLRVGSRPTKAKGQHRTGALFLRGANSISPELTGAELTSKLVTHGHTLGHDKAIGEAGIKQPDGEMFTASKGLEVADRLSHEGRPVVPVRAFQAGLSKSVRERLAEHLSPSQMETLHLDMLNDRIVHAADANDQAKNVVLVGKSKFDRLSKELQPSQHRLLQTLNLPFRYAVLPQPKWVAGNFIEPYLIRLPLSGSGINVLGLATDIRAFHRVVRTLEKGDSAERHAAEIYRGMVGSGLLFGRRSVRRTYEDFAEGTNARRVLYLGHQLYKTPVVKQMADLALLAPRAIFAFNDRLVENPAQTASLGKAFRRDIQAATHSYAKSVHLSQAAIDDAKRGFVNTAAQHRFAEQEYERLGQYAGFRPGVRGAVQGPMPFLPWTLASLRFIYWTLPAHHTVAFDSLMRLGAHVVKQWEAEHAGTPPGLLRASPIAKDGGLIPLPNYGPEAITWPISELAKGGKLKNAAQPLTSTLLPQISGLQESLEGRDPFGKELQFSGGSKEPGLGRELIPVGNSLLGSSVPLVAIIQRILEGGGTPYADSTILSPKTKPGTKHQSGLNRALNPLRETYLKAPAGGGVRSGGGGTSVSDELARLREEVGHPEAREAAAAEELAQLRREAGGR